MLGLIRWQKGRKVEQIEPAEDNGGDVRITLVGGESSTVSMQVFNVWANRGVRAGLQQLTDPLKTPGMESLEIAAPGEEPVIIEEDEARWFAASAGPVIDKAPQDVMAYVEVIGPYFRTGKWRFDAAGTTFFASIEDREFLDRVHRKEYRFAEGDILKVRMRIQRGSGRTEPVRTILQVLEHIPAAPPEEQLDHG